MVEAEELFGWITFGESVRVGTGMVRRGETSRRCSGACVNSKGKLRWPVFGAPHREDLGRLSAPTFSFRALRTLAEL